MKKMVCILLVLWLCQCAAAELLVDLNFAGGSMDNFGTAGETAYLDGGSALNFVDGVATAKTGAPSVALDLTGTGDKVTLGSLLAGQGGVIDALNGLKSFTISMWVKGDLLENAAPINRRENSGQWDYNIQARTDQWGRPRGIVNGGWGQPSTNGYFGYVDTWAFLAMTYDSTRATEQIGFYRNTVDSTTAFLHGIRQTAGNPVIGGPVNVSDYPIYFGQDCNVVIDNIKIYGSKTDASGDLSNNDSLKWIFWGDMQTEEVPEPATLSLLTLGGIAILSKRKK